MCCHPADYIDETFACEDDVLYWIANVGVTPAAARLAPVCQIVYWQYNTNEEVNVLIPSTHWPLHMYCHPFDYIDEILGEE